MIFRPHSRHSFSRSFAICLCVCDGEMSLTTIYLSHFELCTWIIECARNECVLCPLQTYAKWTKICQKLCQERNERVESNRALPCDLWPAQTNTIKISLVLVHVYISTMCLTLVLREHFCSLRQIKYIPIICIGIANNGIRKRTNWLLLSPCPLWHLATFCFSPSVVQPFIIDYMLHVLWVCWCCLVAVGFSMRNKFAIRLHKRHGTVIMYAFYVKKKQFGSHCFAI